MCRDCTDRHCRRGVASQAVCTLIGLARRRNFASAPGADSVTAATKLLHAARVAVRQTRAIVCALCVCCHRQVFAVHRPRDDGEGAENEIDTLDHLRVFVLARLPTPGIRKGDHQRSGYVNEMARNVQADDLERRSSVCRKSRQLVRTPGGDLGCEWAITAGRARGAGRSSPGARGIRSWLSGHSLCPPGSEDIAAASRADRQQASARHQRA